MKILIAPLNWGLGHATRCAQLVYQFVHEGHEVVLGGDGDSLLWLRRYFPDLRVIYLASLRLRYSRSSSQAGAILCAIPRLICFSLADARALRRMLHYEHFDMLISDNRFGLYARRAGLHTIYVTHQLQVLLPSAMRWLQPLATRLHARIYNRYDEVWVPDYPTQGLSGCLGHPQYVSARVRYIGPLSRFALPSSQVSARLTDTYDVVAVLSGLEPQRTLFEQELLHRFGSGNSRVLIVRGLVGEPWVKIEHGLITLVPYIDDNSLRACLLSANTIIARSGYSTLMDLTVLGVLSKAELHPTPGQSEQEYLATYLASTRA